MCEICQHWALITGLCPRVTRNGHLSARAENVRSKSLDNNQKWKNLRFTLFFAHCVNFFLTTWQIEFGQFVVKTKCCQRKMFAKLFSLSYLFYFSAYPYPVVSASPCRWRSLRGWRGAGGWTAGRWSGPSSLLRGSSSHSCRRWKYFIDTYLILHIIHSFCKQLKRKVNSATILKTDIFTLAHFRV